MIDRLISPNEDVREKAFHQLENSACDLDRREVDGLVEALDHPDPEVRMSASAALSRVRVLGTDVVTRVARSLRDPNPTVRGNIAQTIGRIGPQVGAEARGLLELALQLEEDDWAAAVIDRAIERVSSSA